MKRTFTFVVNFRGGTYCTQVQENSIKLSLVAWVKKIRDEKAEIKHLGENTLAELEKEATNTDNLPTPLTGLKNIWFTILGSRKGSFHINIIQTDVS